MADDRYTCLIGGKSYGRMYEEVPKHGAFWWNKSDRWSEESERESRGKDSDGSDEEMSSDDLEDNSVYRGWYDDAVEASQQSRIEKFEKYLKDDMPEDRAREKAYARTVWAIKNDFFQLIRNIPGTDPTNPERQNLPGYLVGHRGEGRRRNGRPQSGEEGSAQTLTQIRKPFRIRSGCSVGWQPGVRWSRFGRCWIALASARLLKTIAVNKVTNRWRNHNNKP